MTTIRAAIDRAAHRFPDKEAIRCTTKLTFAEFKNRTRNLASSLYRLGLKPGDRVAVFMQNCHQNLELLHGLPAGGLTVVPLNWRLTGSEVEYVLEDCQARALFVSDAFYPLVEGIRPNLKTLQHIVAVGHEGDGLLSYEELTGSDSESKEVAIHEDDRACILYTSGTTGFPKGAVLTHRNLIDSALLGIGFSAAGVSHRDNALIFVPLYHVAGTVTATIALLSGARTVLMKTVDIPKIFETVQSERITRMIVVPFIMHHMVEFPQKDQYDLSSLKTVVYAGAPTPVPLLKKALDCFGYIFVQGYGLTETGPSGTVLTAEEHREAVEKGKEHILGSAGREMLHCDVRVVDDSGGRLPANEIGEVVIRSTSVMKEYWGKPEVTAQAIRDDWFYTGDMGRFDDEGYLYLVDRKKDMIISGGENVYPSEVERVLFRHPSVADCTVIGLPDTEWGEKVTAVVVLKLGTGEDPAQITQFCRASLAGYKCPKAVHFVEALPRNPSGKVLKKNLRQELGGGK